MKAKSLYKRLEKILLTVCYNKWGTVSEVARRLGLSYKAARYKFKEYRIKTKYTTTPNWASKKPPEYWRKMKLWDQLTEEEFKKYGIK